MVTRTHHLTLVTPGRAECLVCAGRVTSHSQIALELWARLHWNASSRIVIR